ncbi:MULTISPECIES: glycosyltransferase [unclassified Mesorhizobium]|uniref:glycosyltransferase n=1 Tax=unclassified Mesorhizobium TaxID=325217 RepID=UPI000FD31B82|nr:MULTISPECIES: glycosyltransferase [unclassified Mesorhizobium]RVB80569.1 glycosyltransferase [Mesorhizobium sp. M6A.T.Cr.TU.014.01.1.1]RWP97572.1 MAG: glycosyltransferase [Mesorhizobium sp.]RWQ10845.1 MAG: glycosyltransferase [Mesorhizobium sp.]
MKVAMVAASLSRNGAGVSAAVEALSFNVERHGMDVHVFGLDDAAWLAGENDSWRGAPFSTFRVFGPRPLGFAPDMVRSLIDWTPDIVHVHGIWMHPSRSVLQWARLTRRPYLISPHGMLDPWAVRNSALKKRLAGILYERAHLNGAAAFHALCEPESDAIRSFGLGNPIHIIPNGIEMPNDGPVLPSPWSGQFPPAAKVMLFLGRLHPKKNLPALLKAWKVGARKTRGQWRLVIAGWDQQGHEQELQNLRSHLGLEGEVVFLGPLFAEAKEAAFRNASAFVLPSLSEGLPVTILEALSFGVPVLMTDACNLAEVFAAGAAHRLNLAPDAMSEDLSHFLSLDDIALLSMGRKGQQLASHNYRWTHIAEHFIDVYTNLYEHSKSSDYHVPIGAQP